MRPSKSCVDMELKSLKKKFKDRKFAAGCSRDIITLGAGDYALFILYLICGIALVVAFGKKRMVTIASVMARKENPPAAHRPRKAAST